VNYIEQYHEQMLSGEVLVNQKVRRSYDKLIQMLAKSEKGESRWVYDDEKALFVIDFIETFCKHSKGKWAGKSVTLELWQKALICALYGFVDRETGLRKYTELVLFIPRKSGKSLLASCLMIYHLVADGEMGPELYTAGTTYKQATIVYDESRKMIKKSPGLWKEIRTTKLEVFFDAVEGIYRPLASDSHSLDGLNASCISADELHAWNDVNLYDVLKDSQIAREQPMFLAISTMGTVRGSAFDMVYQEAEGRLKEDDDEENRTLDIIYELDDPQKNIHKPEMWAMCHPMLNVTVKLATLMNKYKKALKDNTQLPNFLTKYFNVRSSSSVAWLQFDQYNNEMTFVLSDMEFRYFIGGADMSKSNDWTSACCLMRKPNDDNFYFEHMYWITEGTYENLSKKMPLEVWKKKGYLRICPGNMVDQSDVISWFVEMQRENDVYNYKTGYDNWSSTLFVANMSNEFGSETLANVIQGKKTLSAPMHYLAKAFENKKIIYNNNPITKIHIGNTQVDVDKNGNIQPIKGTDNAKKIDGLACMLNAMVVYLDNAEEFDQMI